MNPRGEKTSVKSSKERLCIKLDPREHFWRITSQVAELSSARDDDSSNEVMITEWSCDIDLICDASGMVNSPLFTLCSVEEVEKSAESTPGLLTEVVTPLSRDRVDYLSNGKMFYVVEGEEEKEDNAETDV